MIYSKEDIQGFNHKDMRISLLSFFSSLSRQPGATYEKAKEMNDKLYRDYPFIEKEISTGEPPSQTAQRPQKQEGKFCPVCQSPMIRQTQKSNKNAPDWKCSSKGCKFKWDTHQRKWVPGEYVTGVWDDKPSLKSMWEDSVQDEASHIPVIEDVVPPEYS